MRNPGNYVGPTGRVVVIVVGILIALVILIFLLWKPISPNFEPTGFGAPAAPEESVPLSPGK